MTRPRTPATPRALHVWTRDDELELIAMHARGMRHQEIGIRLGRTRQAVTERLKDIRLRQRRLAASDPVAVAQLDLFGRWQLGEVPPAIPVVLDSEPPF